MTRHAIHTIFEYSDGTHISGPATHVELDNDGTAKGVDKAIDAVVNNLAKASGARSVSTLYNDPGRFPVLISYSSGSYDADGVYTVNYGLD